MSAYAQGSACPPITPVPALLLRLLLYPARSELVYRLPSRYVPYCAGFEHENVLEGVSLRMLLSVPALPFWNRKLQVKLSFNGEQPLFVPIQYNALQTSTSDCSTLASLQRSIDVFAVTVIFPAPL